MARPSHREKLLTEGLRVVHERGFGGASVRDIVQAAGVPQGSFSNHFKSKEAFGLEILDLYLSKGRELMRQTLGNEALPPLQRLRAYIETSKHSLEQDGMRNGCLLGNFTAESGDCSHVIRERLAAVFDELQHSIEACLLEALAAGDLTQPFDSACVACFVVSSLQGAILVAKAQRSVAPVECLEKILFTKLLGESERPFSVARMVIHSNDSA